MKQQPARHRTTVRGAIALALILFAIAGCSLPFSSPLRPADAPPPPVPDPPDPDPSAPNEVVVSGDSFTLAWDEEPSATGGYRLYARVRGSDEWALLADYASVPRFTVTPATLSYGEYDFAVSSLDADGLESDLHHSFDESASPRPWYLVWKAP